MIANEKSGLRFKQKVFYQLLDCVIGNITTRYTDVQNIDEMFNFQKNK